MKHVSLYLTDEKLPSWIFDVLTDNHSESAAILLSRSDQMWQADVYMFDVEG